MLPQLLDVLEIRTNNVVHQPVIKALGVLRKYIGTKHRYYPSHEVVPIEGVVPSSLLPVVIEPNRRGEQRINRINYEMCVLSALRDGFRNKSIWVKGANRYRNSDEDLPADFKKKRTTYVQPQWLPMRESLPHGIRIC